ncbi:hypothetical protein G7009_01280 [Pseudomonas capeferrum]|uniref:hypothetical protein n=1 Tax=Pseudomonas capeferrum TaxID=1495066 RepID=UPI0015E43474|nr:hypothetical protein [Pseudomonas capeferrum]MBA1200435.1 hypothetical protein [Pseudomonas capeferrum]
MKDLWKAKEESDRLLRRAATAQRRYDDAVTEDRPAEEIERLKHTADAMAKDFDDYIQQAFGRGGASLH